MTNIQRHLDRGLPPNSPVLRDNVREALAAIAAHEQNGADMASIRRDLEAILMKNKTQHPRHITL